MGKELTNHAVQAYRMFRGADPSETAKDVAYAVGPHALRMGMSKVELKRWLQSAYGAVWVRESGLNPGLDLKEVLKHLLYAYDKAARRSQTLPSRVAFTHISKSLDSDLDIRKHLDNFGLDWTYDVRTESYLVNGGAHRGGLTFRKTDAGWEFHGPRSGGDLLDSSFDVWKTITQRMASGSLKGQVSDLISEVEYQIEEGGRVSRRLHEKVRKLLTQVEDQMIGDVLEDLNLSALFNALDYLDSAVMAQARRNSRDAQKALAGSYLELRTAR